MYVTLWVKFDLLCVRLFMEFYLVVLETKIENLAPRRVPGEVVGEASMRVVNLG